MAEVEGGKGGEEEMVAEGAKLHIVRLFLLIAAPHPTLIGHQPRAKRFRAPLDLQMVEVNLDR